MLSRPSRTCRSVLQVGGATPGTCLDIAAMPMAARPGQLCVTSAAQNANRIAAGTQSHITSHLLYPGQLAAVLHHCHLTKHHTLPLQSRA